MKYYRQTDPRWSGKKYAGSTIGRAGCGATSVAMVVEKSPKTVAAYLEGAGCTVPGQGTTWAGIKKALEHYGYACNMLNSSNYYGRKGTEAEKKFKDKIKSGKYWGILLMGKSLFTSGGHYIVIDSYKSKKGYKVLDPYSRGLCGYHTASDFDGKVKIFYLIKKPVKKSKKTVSTVTYYKVPAKKYASIVDALGSIGVNSLISNRKKIAKANGIPDYSGTAEQNQKLLEKLYAGKLKKA